MPTLDFDVFTHDNNGNDASQENRNLVMFLHAPQYKKFSSLNVITTRFCNNNNNHVGFLHATIISTTLHKSKKNCASFLHRIVGITFHKSKNKLM
jgi:hypothetical protein